MTSLDPVAPASPSRDHLVHFVCQDLVGITRGRAVPSGSLAKALGKGVGWVPANLGLNPFGTLVDNPWGSVGDLLLMPDAGTEVMLPWGDHGTPLHFFLSDIVELDGSAFAACPRSFLKRQIAALESRGLRVKASFEHEFMLLDIEHPQPSFSLAAARAEEAFCTELVRALAAVGVEPENCLPEYAPRQFEITCAPVHALAAADRAVILRDVLREIARRHGRTASFAPVVPDNEGTSGAHIHLSLWSADDEPLTHDATRPGSLSRVASQFAAGLLAHMNALVALTAPGVTSFQRLKPHSWSAGYACIGDRNREAAVRVAPVNGRSRTPVSHQANLEFRPSDALASPFIALGALIAAGVDGIDRALELPEFITTDPQAIATSDCARYGMRPLPSSLGEALDALAGDDVLTQAMGETMAALYRNVKQSEIAAMSERSERQARADYARVY
ncbi:MAG: Glutamine synthetase [Rhizobacter sp.]|nr:Glutamine synthetase [Rhizobacter sp.]